MYLVFFNFAFYFPANLRVPVFLTIGYLARSVYDGFTCYIFVPLRVSDEREGDHNGRRVGVCYPANYHRQTTVRPSRKNHWPERSMVFRPAVHRQQRRYDLDQTI